jgi:molybdopterin-guanine dinucleotide biosynthesis protein A
VTAKSNRGEINGYVLAGGASSRFGRDKGLVELAGKTALQRACDLVAQVAGSVQVVALAERYPDLRALIAVDRWPGEGPLGGIITALRATESDKNGAAWNLIVSCDMPFLTPEWLEYVCTSALASDAELVVPRSEHGLEPLCACWRTSAADSLQRTFEEGVRKVTEAMKRLRMEILDEAHWKRFDSAGRLFWNMNTPQDYQEALQMWRAEQK